MSLMGRALLLGRRRRRAGMLRNAVGPVLTALHPARLPASGTHVGHLRALATDGFRAVKLHS